MMDNKIENNWVIGLHLVQLINMAVPVGGLIGVLAIWHLKKDESEQIHRQGKEILNFQLSILAISCFAYFVAMLGSNVQGAGAFEPVNGSLFPLASTLSFTLMVLLYGALVGFPILSVKRIREGKGPYYPEVYRFIQ